MTISTAMSPPSPTSEGALPLSPEERAWRGFAIGVGLAVVLTAINLAWEGWRTLLFVPVIYMLCIPALLGTLGFLGLRRRPNTLSWKQMAIALSAFGGGFILAALGFSRFGGGPMNVAGVCLPLPLSLILMRRWLELPPFREWPRKRPTFHLQTLMFLVAYVAVLLGLGISTDRVGRPATIAYDRSISSNGMADIYRKLAEKSRYEAALRLANARGVHEHRIPDTLAAHQVRFLQTADPDETTAHLNMRYRMIAEHEERIGRMEERNAVVYLGLVNHYEAVAAKYRRAANYPWLAVEPDPPMPPNQ